MTAAIERYLAEFQEKSEALGVVVVHSASAEAAGRVIHDWEPVQAERRITLASQLAERSPRLVASLHDSGVQVSLPGSPEQMRDVAVGGSLALLAVAETGSVLLSEQTLGDRSVGMLTLAQIMVCPSEALVASLDDVAPVLRTLARPGGGSMMTLVTGPSRTADIERVLTVGVQGPGRVMIVFVDDL